VINPDGGDIRHAHRDRCLDPHDRHDAVNSVN
jgi:hypothetical protein